MKIAIYDKNTGKIIRRFSGLAEDISAQIMEDSEEFYLNCPEDSTHIMSNLPVVIPQEIPIDAIKVQKLDYIKYLRDNEENRGFEYLGKTFDSDLISIQRILLASRATQLSGIPIDWTCKDGTVIKLTPEQFNEMLIIMAQKGDAIHKRWRQIKESIVAAQTKEEVESISWS